MVEDDVVRLVEEAVMDPKLMLQILEQPTKGRELGKVTALHGNLVSLGFRVPPLDQFLSDDEQFNKGPKIHEPGEKR